MDLVSTICDLWSKSRFNPVPIHEYGHSNNIPTRRQNREQILNCQMDVSTKQMVLPAIITENTNPPSFHSCIGFGTISIRDHQIYNRLQQDLYYMITHLNYTYHVANKLNIAPEDFDTVTHNPRNFMRASSACTIHTGYN